MEQQTQDPVTFADVAEASARNEAAAELETKKAARPPRFFTQPMPVKLTPEEGADIAKELAENHAEIEKIKAEKKTANDDFKSRINVCEVRTGELCEAITTGSVKRPTQCREDHIFETGTVRITRLDTGEVVTERAMLASERQPSLPGIPAAEESDEDVCEASGEDDDEDGEEVGFDHSDPDEDDDADDDSADAAITDPEAVLGESPAAKKTRKKG